MKRPYRSMRNALSCLVLCCVGFSAQPSVALAQQAGTLPGGASSLNETHGDWTVSCVLQETGKRCALSQQQADPKSRQRLLAVELALVAAGKVEGALVLPFGLALDKGVVLRVDEGASTQVLAFRTCLPAGRIVPLSFSADTLGALRNGKQLKLDTVADGGNPVSFTVSLSGLSGALDRFAALAGN